MKQLVLLLIILTTLTNVSYAFFPVTKDLNNATVKTELIEKYQYDDSIQWLFIDLGVLC